MSIRNRQENRFLHDCREKIRTGTADVVSHHEDSPMYGFIKIALLTKSKKITKDTQGELPKLSFSGRFKLFFSSMKIFQSILRESKIQFKELEQNNHVKEIKYDLDTGHAL